MIIVNHNADLWQAVRICASALSLLFCVQAVASFYQRWILIELCKAHKELGCRLSFERYDINSLCFFLAGASCLVLLTLPSQSLASLCNKFGAVWLSFLSSVYRIRFIPYLPQHQPESNTHRPIPARDGCVVVAIARNCGSTTTSNVFCRNIDNSGNGEGKPFQLQKLENRSFWTNEEVNNEELKVGCLLEYRGRTCCQNLLGRLCELGNRDGGQFIFVRNIGKKPQVSFRYYTNSTVVNRFLRNLRCPSVLADLDPPLLIWTPLQNFLFYNFLSIMKLFSFVGGCVCVKTSHCHMSIPVNNLHFMTYSTNRRQSQD